MCIITHLSVNDKRIEYENLKNCKQEAMATDMKIFMGKKVRPLMVFVLVFCAVVTCSCRKSSSKNNKIEIRITERVTKDNTKIQIPEFVSENEEVSRNLKELNKKCLNLQKIAEKEEEKGSHMEMLSSGSGRKKFSSYNQQIGSGNDRNERRGPEPESR